MKAVVTADIILREFSFVDKGNVINSSTLPCPEGMQTV
jgi:hypothetical protein